MVANIKATTTVIVNDGGEIAAEWHHNSADARDDIIATCHAGPIICLHIEGRHVQVLGSVSKAPLYLSTLLQAKSSAVPKPSSASNLNLAVKSAMGTFMTIAGRAATPNAHPWGQCGGMSHMGPTVCDGGCQCRK
ncbi:Endo-beta-14-glucanase D [Pyrenophora seminiperda CCB06]|uniref:Endo-beta-14-glucanase D n=1 Tax=Pyrenophora seminiperda CCB06 TaxID=1302712 RepID=A0A3M7M6Y5_9PLEO|nr:Endo-beta-14-glucanase D [Pyrenophora seminiperda CCB06]